jgi:hypothetical protein
MIATFQFWVIRKWKRFSKLQVKFFFVRVRFLQQQLLLVSAWDTFSGIIVKPSSAWLWRPFSCKNIHVCTYVKGHPKQLWTCQKVLSFSLCKNEKKMFRCTFRWSKPLLKYPYTHKTYYVRYNRFAKKTVYIHTYVHGYVHMHSIFRSDTNMCTRDN